MVALGCAGTPPLDHRPAAASKDPRAVAAAPTLQAEGRKAPREGAENAEAIGAADGGEEGHAQAKASPQGESAEAMGATARPLLTSVGATTWIWPRPRVSGIFIGYIRNGRSVGLRDTALVKGEGCSGGFYAIEPRGYVCRDSTVSIELDGRFREAAEATMPAPGPFPYGYAISNGAPMYNRVPTPGEQAKAERLLGPAGKWKPLIKTLAAHEDLAVTEPIAPRDAMPAFLVGGRPTSDDRIGLVRETIPLGSMLAFTRAFEAEGRTFLLSSDLTVVPANRVRAFRPSAFRGTRLGSDVELPIAWMRGSPRPRYRVEGGAAARTAGVFPVRSFVRLTGASVEHAGEVYLETTEREGGPNGGPFYVAEKDATVVRAREKLPMGVAAGQKWIQVRITQGTLVAYEGLKPVYATLMSPGAGGVPVRGKDPVRASTTPTGTYYVTFKDRAATMSPDKKGEPRTLWIADVPHTQYFNPPFAIHAAYWHERFGEPTSAGCVNVSPVDAEALFSWSDPPVPEGWQGATGSGAPLNGPTTAVVVSR